MTDLPVNKIPQSEKCRKCKFFKDCVAMVLFSSGLSEKDWHKKHCLKKKGENERLYPYIYNWGNNPVRAKLKGKKCRILARGKMNSVALEFENGQQIITSANSFYRELEK
jgi:hypothetical protein